MFSKLTILYRPLKVPRIFMSIFVNNEKKIRKKTGKNSFPSELSEKQLYGRKSFSVDAGEKILRKTCKHGGKKGFHKDEILCGVQLLMKCS